MPDIEKVSHLRGFDILVVFSNGEHRVLDMSDSFHIPAALKYAPLSEFKKIGFNTHAIWWGDRESPDSMEISNDTAYKLSMPVSFNSSIINLSMGRIASVFKDKRGAELAKAYVQSHEVGENPHVFVEYKDGSTCRVFIEDGKVDKARNMSLRVQQALSKWIISIRSEAVEEWNKWYPSMPADPSTGKFVNRK